MSIKEFFLGKPRDVHDPKLFHKISLVAFLAWVGLGGDGLSSSAYGPDEAFRAVIHHPEMAIFLAMATAITVFVISFAYSRLIEHFPHGGGGYVVATKLLNPSFGIVSGCALLIDYVLTITTSMVSAVDQIFSFLPVHYQSWKMSVEALLIILFIILNLRGVKESVMIVVPIFMLFVITHVVVLLGCLFLYGSQIPAVTQQVTQGLYADMHSIGLWALFLIFMNAYSRGAGTYTGIEAVSNGVLIMREPKVPTAKRTMLYMATSLAITAGGILLCYLLTGVTIEEGKTLNAVLVERLHFGNWFVILTLCAEGGLLLIAAQTGFIDGPRVMSNMALDGWLPRRFSSLSERLTTSYGIMLMGAAALASLLYTRGDISALITMYSINVFITFSLTELGMCRFWIKNRKDHKNWKPNFALHFTGLTMCSLILTMVVYEKFTEGGWMTVAVTTTLIALCFLIRSHYRRVHKQLVHLDEILTELPVEPSAAGKPLDEISNSKPTAVVLVSGYSGLGVHSILSLLNMFPNYFKQIVFASVGVIDSGNFKGEQEIHNLEKTLQDSLAKYIDVARKLGYPAASRMSIGTDPVELASNLCADISKEFPHGIFFGGKLIFSKETFFNKILHNETAFAIQRRLQWLGLSMVVLPIRINN